MGSFYYLSYALNHHEFPGADELWEVAGLTVTISILVLGIFANPVVEKL